MRQRDDFGSHLPHFRVDKALPAPRMGTRDGASILSSPDPAELAFCGVFHFLTVEIKKKPLGTASYLEACPNGVFSCKPRHTGS